MRRRAGVRMLAALSLLAAGGVAAEDGAGSWRTRSTLTGDWGGHRSALFERGVDLAARYTTAFWSNLQGGFDTGTRYEGFAEWSVALDLEKLVRWPGAGIEINAFSYHGGQPSMDLVGPFETMTVSGNESFGEFRFFEMYLHQTWADGRFYLKVGQLAADADFFSSESVDQFRNGSFGFLGLTRDVAGFYPVAAPGIYLQARTADAHWEIDVGLYTADPGLDEKSNIGFDATFGDGVSVLAEVRTRRPLFGRRSSWAFGVSYTSEMLENFETGGTVDGGYALFFSIDQTITSPDSDGSILSFFLRGSGSPDQDRARGKAYLDLGLELRRPFASRPEDVLVVGLAYIHFADAYVQSQRANGIDVSSNSATLEFGYRYQATGWLAVQPDLQLFLDPHFGRRDAVVVGVSAMIDF